MYSGLHSKIYIVFAPFSFCNVFDFVVCLLPFVVSTIVAIVIIICCCCCCWCFAGASPSAGVGAASFVSHLREYCENLRVHY